MASHYLLQIIERDSGKVVRLEPGGPVETQLVSDLSSKLLEKRVGFFTTKAKVVAIVEESLKEIIKNLKRKI